MGSLHPQGVLARRADRSRPLVGAVVVSLLVHGLGAVALSQIEFEKSEPERVLRVRFVSKGVEEGKQEPTSEPAEQAEPVAPRPQPQPRPEVVPPRPVPPAPQVPQPSDIVPPDIQFPALYAAAQIRTQQPVDLKAPPEDFETYQKRKADQAVPSHLRYKGGGEVDGNAAIDTEGVDRCQPAEGRVVERLYLLYDSSGSMSSQLRNQALSCAQQYAGAVIDAGGEVVVGNFARSASFEPATRNPMDVAFALRAENDARATFLPSADLNPFFDQRPDARADLVILSDGYIPNYRAVLPWYRYFLNIRAGNRGYLYTLGTRGPPEVTEALRKIGYEIRVYRTL